MVGVPNLSVTHLRKAAEKILQENDKMRKKAKAINNHTPLVGEVIYDPSKSSAKAQFVNRVEKVIESPQKTANTAKRITIFDEERKLRKKDVEHADKIAREKHAKKVLLRAKLRKSENAQYNQRVRVLSHHRLFLQKLLFKEMFENTVAQFPQGRNSFISKDCYFCPLLS